MTSVPAGSTGTPLVDAALGYAASGLHVFPLHTPTPAGGCSCRKPACDAQGKHPRTQHGFKDATTDEKTIREWWRKWPDANIGIATGKVSGIAVLDIDNKNDGMKKLHDLEARHGNLPITPKLRTGNGYHLYFCYSNVPITSESAISGITGLDVRGDGGYVVAPPSRHVSGNDYLWELGLDEMVLPPMPEWLITMITAPAPAPVPGKIADAGSLIHDGRRGATLASLAGSMRHRGMTEPEIEVALQKVNSGRCDPCLPPQKVADIARSIARYPISANSANSANQVPLSMDWEPPTPFHEFDLPPFPADALPAPLRAFVEALAVATQTPPDMAAMLALSVCAASCAKKVRVEVDEGWYEPLNLFIVTVLKPGNRKSAVFSAIEDPLKTFEEDECKRVAPEVKAALTRYNITQQALKKAERDAGQASPENKGALTEKAEQLAKELATMKPPAMPRFIADDATPERLTGILQDQDGRIAVMSPEGGVFDLMAGRYSASGMPNFEVYLKGHAGDDLRVDRVTRPAEHIKGPAVTVGLAVQPEVIRGLMDKPGFRGRGLLARFLYSIPESLVGRRKVRPPSVRLKLKLAYHGIVRRLLEIPWATDQNANRVDYILRLDVDARAQLQAFEERLEPQLAEHGELGNIADWGAKLAGAVMRIAGTLHMIENAGTLAPWNLPIEATTVERAIRIGKYLIPHARAAHAAMGAVPEVDDAKRILRWIGRSSCESFTKRDCFEGTKGHFKKVAVMEPALVMLCDHDYIRERPAVDRQGAGRKPSPIYEVNPRCLSQYSHNSRNSSDADDSANTTKLASQAEAAVEPRAGTPASVDPVAGDGQVHGGGT